MFEAIIKFFKKLTKSNAEESNNSKDTAKERLHLVLMQDRANVSADFLELMKQEIIDVIKKYIEVDENAIDVRLTNKTTEEGENGAPALYANIPILNIRNDMKKVDTKQKEDTKSNEKNVAKTEQEQDVKDSKSGNVKEAQEQENNVENDENVNSNVEEITQVEPQENEVNKVEVEPKKEKKSNSEE